MEAVAPGFDHCPHLTQLDGEGIEPVALLIAESVKARKPSLDADGCTGNSERKGEVGTFTEVIEKMRSHGAATLYDEGSAGPIGRASHDGFDAKRREEPGGNTIALQRLV